MTSRNTDMPEARPQQRGTLRRASVGRVLVAVAIFAPALFIIGGLLLSRGSIYSRHLSGPRWPWIAGDVLLLLIGSAMMRGEDL